MSPTLKRSLLVAALVILSFTQASGVNAQEVPGYTEPIQQVEVAARESGLLEKLNVKLGEKVRKGELLGQLDNQIQKAQLEIANHLVTSKGDLDRAESELKTKVSILNHFERLSSEGFAQEKEILRAKMEVEIGKANLLAHIEKNIEYSKRMELAKLHLERRDIRSPISGQVMELHREIGEFVPITDPRILTLVQTSPIRGKFQVQLSKIDLLPVGEEVTVKVAGQVYQGKVESVGLVAKSEIVPVHVTFDNSKNRVKLGQKCTLVLPQK